MLLWCFILFILGICNLLIALTDDYFKIPNANEILAVAILLVAAGILYRVYFKSRNAEREKMAKRLAELEGTLKK